MTRAILHRVARGVTTILIVATLVFIIVRVTGDPVRALLPEGTPTGLEDVYRRRWGLDQPVWQQYVLYLTGIARGDFGQSYFGGGSALTVVLERVPATLNLAIPSFIISTLLGVTSGTVAALRRGRLLDRVLSSTSLVASTVPPFIVGVLLVFLFSVTLRWFPSAGDQTLQHLVLPLITLTIVPAAVLARMTRASMADALALPSVDHAKALGLPRHVQVLQYALPNALLPLLTVLGFELAYMIAGSSVIEVLYGWPGVGRLFIQAADRSDYAVVQTIVILITASVVTFLALTDTAYRAADPRLRRRAR